MRENRHSKTCIDCDDIDTHLLLANDVLKSLGHLTEVTCSWNIHVDSHDLRRPVHAHNTNSIIAHSTNRSGNVCAMAESVKHVIIFTDYIPAINIIDIPVSIIVLVVAWNLSRILPKIICKIWMREIDTTVEHRNDR